MSIEIQKVLKKAIPTVRTTDQVVKSWEITVNFKEESTGWSRDYTVDEDVEYLDLKATDFSKDQLINLMPSNFNQIFEAHFLANNLPPTEERVSDFNISILK